MSTLFQLLPTQEPDEPVNHVVLVSRKGFTKEVLKRAKKENIEVLTLAVAKGRNWTEQVPQSISYSFAPHVAAIDVEPKPTVNRERFALNAVIVCTCCGRQYGTPFMMASRLLSDPDFRDELRVVASKAGGPCCRQAHWTFGENMALDLGGTRQPLRSLTVHYHCVEARGALRVTDYEYKGQLVQHMVGDVGGTQIQFVLGDGDHSKVLPLKITPGTPMTPQTNSIAPSVPSVRRIPDQFKAVVNEVREYFSQVDITITEEPVVHNFASGLDERWHLLLTTTIGGVRGPRTGIAFYDIEPADVGLVRAISQRMHGCELDHVVAVHMDEFSGAAQALAAELGVSLVSLVNQRNIDWATSALGDVQLWFLHPISASYKVTGAERARDISLVNSGVIQLENGRRVSTQVLHQMILVTAAQSTERDIASRRVAFADEEQRFPFEIVASQASRMVLPDGQAIPLRFIKGEASVRVIWARLDCRRIIEENGRTVLRLGNKLSGTENWVDIGTLPRTPNLDFKWPNMMTEPKQVMRPRRSLFVPAFSSRQLPTNAPLQEDNGVHGIYDAKHTGNTRWSIRIASVQDVRLERCFG